MTSNPDREKFVRKDQLSLADYKALQDKETKQQAKRFKIPLIIKIILATPFILIALFGLFYIPYLAIQQAANNSTSDTTANK